MTPGQRLRIERGVERLHRLGARPMAELMIELVSPVGESDLLIRMLDRWGQRLTPEALRVTGGDRFAPRLVVVPLDLRSTGRRA